MNNPENQLNQETSPYLLQHADNPVNWHAWNPLALTRAQQENKPILLSIGYSACHWCHVMAHESFEDEETARIMNAHFINIKVDREERPDLDKIYQTAHSILTGRPGGWPLTVFLTPDDRMPFFAGTYFPKQRRYGMPSFSELLLNIKHLFDTRFDDIKQQNNSLRDLLSSDNTTDVNTAALTAMPIDLARRQLLAAFDPQHGGFSKAPKFPHPPMLERALRQWCLTHTHTNDDQPIFDVALISLTRMAMGGVFDHIGGGFCRYSTDDFWMIPHFEKMLYDNGQLMPLYVYAWQISQDNLFKNTVKLMADWIMREMQSPQGGYYSAQDADSEGEEGKYYIWNRDEIRQKLDMNSYEIFSACFGLNKSANFEQHWHLHRYFTDTELADTFHLTEVEIEQSVERSREILFAARAQRIAPGTDDKILTSWNGLMIHGMSLAGRIMKNEQYLDSASKALRFVQDNMWRDNKFLATSKNGKTHLNAYLDDYAYMLLALIEYLQCRWDNDLLDWAGEIADALLTNFEDKTHGGFFFTSHDHEQLIQRIKTFGDDAIPSGNGIATLALQRLGLLLGKSDYLVAAERCLQTAATHINQHAVLHCSLLNALEEYLNPPVIIILRGDNNEIKNWRQEIDRHYLPRTLCFAIASNIKLENMLAEKQPMPNTCAYICEGTKCLPPITSFDNLIEYLHAHNSHISNA